MATLPGILSLWLVFGAQLFMLGGMSAYTDWQVKTPIYANHLADALVRLMNKTCAISQLEIIYQDLTNADLMSVAKNDLLKQMATEVSYTLTQRMRALKRLVDVAEDAVMNYSFNPLLKKGDVDFVDVKNIEGSGLTLGYDPNFKTVVNFSTSAVHIPVEIFEGYSIIQNELKWSKVLNWIFKDNNERFKDLSWQFFGSQSGMMRVYPASPWRDPPEDIPDLYDVRRRPWYIEASTSPKDMLIMIDTSGSVHGQTLDIMKMSVKTLLNTLGENDYVNVASFSKEVKWISCLNTFVQASSVNKMILFEAIDGLKDGDMASYSQALQFAFKEFSKFDETKNVSDGSQCHKVIMFFTDGGTEDPQEVYLEYNNKSQIRIFTFATGPHAVPIHTIKAMACYNKGYFSAISSLGAIRTGVQEYVRVLSRPMVLSGEKQFEWTNFYDDVMGLGMVTTVTLPVYNRSNHEGQSQSIVGVMGVDVPVKSLEALGPARQLGPVGYTFAINNNGFIVFHPDMKTKGDYLDDPPEVDLMDLEEDSHLMNVLRRRMIDRRTGNVTSDTIETLPDQKYVYKQKKIYYYTPIENTSFSLGLVIPADREYYLNIRRMETDKGLSLQESDGALVAPWPYCKGYPDAPTAHDIAGLSLLIQKGKECHSKMVQHLLWDIKKTHSITGTWTEQYDNGPFRDHVESIFLGTEGGLTRVYPPSEVGKFKSYADTWHAQYYQRALYARTKWIFRASIDPGSGNNDSFGIITAVKSVIITSRKRTFKPAVVGVQFRLDGILQLLEEGSFADVGGEKNYRQEQLPCNEDGVVCYLVDDGGYVVATTHENRLEKVTKFLGDADPELMWALYHNGVYTRKKTYNYQALCPVVKDGTNAGSSFTKVPLLNLGSVHWMFDLMSWIYLKFNLWSFFQSLFSPSAEAIFEFGSIYKEKMRCVTVQHQYFYGANISYVGEMVCDGCARKMSAMRLEETNLLLIAAQVPCVVGEFCQRISHLSQKPEKVANEKLCMRPSRYRRRPADCYAHDANETTWDCSAAASLNQLANHLAAITLSSVYFLNRLVFL